MGSSSLCCFRHLFCWEKFKFLAVVVDLSFKLLSAVQAGLITPFENLCHVYNYSVMFVAGLL